MKRPLLLLLTLLLVAGAGCKPKEDATAPVGTTPGSAPSATTEKTRVVYIPKNTGNPYFDGIVAGFEKGAQSLPILFATTAPAQPDPTAQISFLKDEVQRGAKIVCITPNSVDALNGVFDEARQKGVKIVTVNADITGNESHRDACVLPTDFDKLGESQIELLGSLTNYAGKFAILSATTDAPDQNYWINGMKAALQQPKYAKMRLVEIVYGDDKDQKSLTEAEALLTKYPDLRGILAPTSVGVAAAAKAVETAGVYPGGPNVKNGGVVVTGLGTPNQMRRYLKEKIVPAVALWSPPDQGLLAAYVAAKLADGSLTAKPGQTVDVPGLGERTFNDKTILITGPPVVFTAENVDQYQF